MSHGQVSFPLLLAEGSPDQELLAKLIHESTIEPHPIGNIAAETMKMNMNGEHAMNSSRTQQKTNALRYAEVERRQPSRRFDRARIGLNQRNDVLGHEFAQAVLAVRLQPLGDEPCSRADLACGNGKGQFDLPIVALMFGQSPTAIHGGCGRLTGFPCWIEC